MEILLHLKHDLLPQVTPPFHQDTVHLISALLPTLLVLWEQLTMQPNPLTDFALNFKQLQSHTDSLRVLGPQQ